MGTNNVRCVCVCPIPINEHNLSVRKSALVSNTNYEITLTTVLTDEQWHSTPCPGESLS